MIDLQFYDKMTEKEQGSLIKQLSHCHSTNRKTEKCFNYILTSASSDFPLIQRRCRRSSPSDTTWTSGASRCMRRQLTWCSPMEKLVYLTGDAQEEVNQLEQEYVFG